MQPILVQSEQGHRCSCDIITHTLKERTIHIFVRSLFSQVFISIFNSFGKMAETFSSLEVLGLTAARVILLRTRLKEQTIHIFVRSLFSPIFISIFSIHLGRTVETFSSLKVLEYGRGIVFSSIFNYILEL